MGMAGFEAGFGYPAAGMHVKSNLSEAWDEEARFGIFTGFESPIQP